MPPTFISNGQVAHATSSPLANVNANLRPIMDALQNAGIIDLRAIAGALATVAVENHFTPEMELSEHGVDAHKYFEDKYGYQTKKGKELDNTAPGDGFKYRGGGYAQLTGKSNYKKYSAVAGIDLVVHPEKILDPVIGSKVFAEFWKDHDMDKHCIRGNWRMARVRYNGGLNNFAAFETYVYNLLDLLYAYPVTHEPVQT